MRGALLLAALCLAGCAGRAARERDALDALERALPGEYSSAREADAVGVRLLIRRVSAPAVGEAVFYVHATADDDPRRVLWERVWTLAAGDEGLTQQVFRFKEPQRWAQAPDEPELLQSMLPDDLAPLDGCALAWRRDAAGFTAQLRDPPCRAGAALRGLWAERQIGLEGGALTLQERQIGSGEDAPVWSLRLRRDGPRG